MASNLYITTTEARSGKSAIVLGIMEMLLRDFGTVGFFRPIVDVTDAQSDDRDIRLVRDYFELEPEDACYAYTLADAAAMLNDGRQSELLEGVLSRYKELEQRCDFVLCEGTDFEGVTSAFEFDINVDIANNLGSPVLVVTNGRGKGNDEIVGSTAMAVDTYEARDARVIGAIINRCPAENVEQANAQLRGRLGDDEQLGYALSEEPELGKPTPREIAQALELSGRQILAEGAEPLRTVVPTASAYPGWDFPNPHGIFLSYATRWLAFVQERASQSDLFGDSDYWNSKYRALHQSGAAFPELEATTGLSLRSAEIFRTWIEHPHLDDYWQAPSPDSADYRGLDLPILTITGHFDGDQPGALRYYQKHMQHGSEAGTEQHYLLMGPWSHGGTRRPASELGDLTFADTAAIDMDRLHRQWFDWTLRDGPKPPMLTDRVVYYVMGANRWRTAPSLEAVADTSRTLHLHSPDTNPDDPFNAGQLTGRPPNAADTDSYVYDPRDTADVATLDAMEDSYTAPGAAFLEGPKLVYHSAPVEESFELSGRMRLDAWIELDVPDTDVAAWVYEVRPTGQTIYLGETMIRARHRNGVDTSELVEPGTIERHRFDRFYWTSRQIQEGSRIRLVIAPLNDPERQKNYHSGKPPMQESIDDARTATVTLHVGPDYPSQLVLPVRSDDQP